MPDIANYYFRAAIVFLIVGIAVGLHMSISGNHNVTGAHAHINLLGWVTSALFGTYFALNPNKTSGRLPMIQFWIHIVGVAVMTIALYLLLLGNVAVEPIVALGSIVTFVGVLIFAWIIWTPARR